MKMTKYIGVILIALLTLSSCETWLDINQNGNAVSEIEPEYLFGYAITSWSGNRTGGDSHMPIELMNQTAASGGDFGWGFGEDRYDISVYSLGNTWKMYYATSGANLQEAIRIAEEQEKPNVAAQCKITLAALMYECTMIWGDIPYTQAWDNSVSYPEFDAQKDVLNNLLTLVDAGVNQINASSPFVITTEDVYFNGDLNKWKLWANTIKLKIAMTMVDADPSKATLVGELVKGNLISATENVEFPYFDEAGHKNPKFRVFEKYGGSTNTWILANSIMLDDMMKPLDDPRIPIYFSPGKDAVPGPDYYKGVYTATTADDTHSFIRVGTLIKADAPDLIYSSHEIKLMQAEAYLRGLGVAADKVQANTYFKQGLEEALAYYGVAADDITTFVNKPELDLTTVTDPLTVLRKQQWVDLLDRPLESWIQVRRSGVKGSEVPNLKTPDGAPVPDGEIARRWDYPSDELSGNINKPAVLPKMWDSMWFDK